MPSQTQWDNTLLCACKSIQPQRDLIIVSNDFFLFSLDIFTKRKNERISPKDQYKCDKKGQSPADPRSQSGRVHCMCGARHQWPPCVCLHQTVTVLSLMSWTEKKWTDFDPATPDEGWNNLFGEEEQRDVRSSENKKIKKDSRNNVPKSFLGLQYEAWGQLARTFALSVCLPVCLLQRDKSSRERRRWTSISWSRSGSQSRAWSPSEP